MYYIPVYVQLVLLTPVLGWLVRSRWRPVLWALSPACVVLAVYVPTFGGMPLPGVVAVIWGECCLGWLCFYCLGLALGNGVIELRSSTRLLTVGYVLLIVVQMAEGYVFLLWGNANCGTQLKLSSLVTSTVFCLLAWRWVLSGRALPDNASMRLGLSLGACSFGVYLSHMMFLRLFRHFIPDSSLITFAAAFVFTLVASWLFVWLAGLVCGRKVSRVLGLR